jgi:uncharacterized repeat protein (TIGR03833 family)
MKNSEEAGKHLENISPGVSVEIFLKEDRYGKNPVQGIIQDVLTHSSFHPHGIMVQLEDGKIGRVQRIISDKSEKTTIPKQENAQSSQSMKYASLNNIEKIQQYLVETGKVYCDDCLSEILSIFPRQQINQGCRRLESEGIIRRQNGTCYSCSKNKIVNSSGDILPISVKKTAPILPSQKSKEIDFPSLINNGENEFVEFKSSILWSKTLTEEEMRSPQASRDIRNFGRDASKVIIAKTLAGFLNTHGGHLVIGIKENKTKVPDEIIGIESEFGKLEDQCTDGYRRMIVDSIIRKYFHPDIYNHFSDYIKITFPEINEMQVCWIQIEKSEVSAFLTIRNEDYFFIRLDAETRQLVGKEMVEYCAKRFVK